MAKTLSSESVNRHKKRPGINSKNKSSNHKSSKYYIKAYRGQGR